MKWGITAANINDFQRPAEGISYPQQLGTALLQQRKYRSPPTFENYAQGAWVGAKVAFSTHACCYTTAQLQPLTLRL